MGYQSAVAIFVPSLLVLLLLKSCAANKAPHESSSYRVSSRGRLIREKPWEARQTAANCPIFQNEVLHAVVDRICDMCHEMFRNADPNLRAKCRLYFKGKTFNGAEKAKGQIYAVTGANCGIGKQVVRELNYRGAKVYMGCRSLKKGEDALAELVKAGCAPDRLVLLQVDLSSFVSIENFVNAIMEKEEKLDGLVNNAGVMFYPKFQLTSDGHETTWQVNFLSNVLLCEKLLPLLERSQRGRIVLVSSRAHRFASTLNLETIDSRTGWDRFISYGKSKLAQIVYASVLSERLRNNGSKVTVNACHPGTCYTHLMRYTPLINTKLIKFFISPFVWFFMKTPKDGAQTPLYLLLSKKVDGVSGKYFAELNLSDTSSLATDDDLRQRLKDYLATTCGSK